jgi:glycosyltransferase involved in cell wall biosynthesis
MNKISAIVIARNEEKMIADCLESLSFCDEIVVINDGSSDKTADIAKRFTHSIYASSEKSVGYVEAVRQYAIEKATHEWILFVDADERVTKDLAHSIKDTLENPRYSAYTVIRRNFYLGNHPWPTNDILERCFKKEAVKDWKWKLHTSPEIVGGIGKLSGYLNHYTHQDLTTMVAKTIQWSTVEAKLRFDVNHPKMSWWRFPRVMSIGFYEWYIKQNGWKVGSVGIIEGMYQAFSMFVTYAKLWELQEQKR